MTVTVSRPYELLSDRTVPADERQLSFVITVPVLTPTVDIANARLTFASGAVANITASRVSKDRFRKIRIFQQSGYLSLDLAQGNGEFYRMRGDLDLAALAKDMRLALVEVYEVATFYAHFGVVMDGEEPPPFLTVRVCDSLSCALNGAETLLSALQSDLGRSVRVGRPKGLTGLPEAHSGPGFATLAGLAFFAASDPIDLRGLVPSQQMVHRQRGLRGFWKLVQAAKANY